MKSNIKDRLLEKYSSEAGTYFFYDHYIIAEINEGTKLTIEQTNKLLPLINKHYGDSTPFGYISNRINSYSISPLNHLQCPGISMPNFKGFAAVTYTRISKMTTEIEEKFVKTPFKQFSNLDEAIEWISKI